MDLLAASVKLSALRCGSHLAQLSAELRKYLENLMLIFHQMGFPDCNIDLLLREVSSLLSVPLDAKWTKNELPIPKHLFV